MQECHKVNIRYKYKTNEAFFVKMLLIFLKFSEIHFDLRYKKWCSWQKVYQQITVFRRQQLVKLDGMGLLIKASKVSRKNRFSNKLWLGLTPTHSKHLMMWSKTPVLIWVWSFLSGRDAVFQTLLLWVLLFLCGVVVDYSSHAAAAARARVPTAHCPARPMASPPLLPHTGLVLLIQLIITQTWARDWIRTHQKL